MLNDSARKGKQRFTLLLLDDGDSYLRDWVATCRPPSVSARHTPPVLKGRLRLCARSLFFEPQDVSVPIYMFPFRKVSRVEPGPAPRTAFSNRRSGRDSGLRSQSAADTEGLLLQTSLCVKMKENGLDTPYSFEKAEQQWWFSLDYAPVHQILTHLNSLLMVKALPYEQQLPWLQEVLITPLR